MGMYGAVIVLPATIPAACTAGLPVTAPGNNAIAKSPHEPRVRLKAGERYSPALAHADALRIRDHYRCQGRLLTGVEPRII